MALPYFFVENISGNTIMLDEDESKHIISVLRMKKGEKLLLTNGKGSVAECEISDDHRKKCTVSVLKTSTSEKQEPAVTIAISLVKNSSRFEWFLEKATEIGVTEIIPLICVRTEKEKFRIDRMRSVMISAMLQSQQSWLPELTEPVEFENLPDKNVVNKLIAHCLPGEKNSIKNVSGSSIIMIGPEGDFTETEITSAISKGFKPVTLGSTRLRTETAGMVAAALLRNL